MSNENEPQQRSTTSVLDEIVSEVRALRTHGQEPLAKAIEDVCARLAVSRPMVEMLNWLSEGGAMTRSGRSKDYFRIRFPGWEARGLARFNPRNKRERQYLEVIVPYRPDIESARAAAREAVGAA